MSLAIGYSTDVARAKQITWTRHLTPQIISINQSINRFYFRQHGP